MILRTALLLLLLVTPTWAATYTVSRGEGDTPLGSNATSCLAAQDPTTPKLTIGGASGGWACATVPGDVVEVRGGTYPESLSTGQQVLTKGTPERGMTLRGRPGETVWLQPRGGCTVIDLRRLEALTYWTFQGVNVNGKALGCGASTTNGISINGPSAFITVQDLTILDVSNNGTGGGTAIGLSSSGPDVTLRRMEVSGTHQQFGDSQGSHCLYMSAGGPDYAAHRQRVEDGSYHDCGGYGIQFNNSSVGSGQHLGGVIRGNRLYRNGRRTSGSTGGLVLNNHQAGVEVSRNLIYGQVRGAGIDIYGVENADHWIHHNTLVGNPLCVTVGRWTAARGTRLDSNLCVGNREGITVFPLASGTVVSHNLSADGTGLVESGTGSTLERNLSADPRLVDVSSGDYRLQAGSPAIGAGTDQSDIGALPYEPPPPPPPPPPVTRTFTCTFTVGDPLPFSCLWVGPPPEAP